MITIDSLLPTISNSIKSSYHNLPKKDKNILVSLAKQVSSGIFLTENQANLLVKIINENNSHISTIIPEVDLVIANKSWTKPFREVNRIKKICIIEEFPSKFVVEFSFNTRLKEKMSQLSAQLQGNIFLSGTKHVIPLTEENLQLVMNTFHKDGFEIDEKIQVFLKEILKISEESINPFDIRCLKNEKIKFAVVDAMGDNFLDNAILLQDRKIRFQYHNVPKIEETSLASKIANRPNRTIFVDSLTTEFDVLLKSLMDLNRLPALLIFDGHNSTKDKESLILLKNAVSKLGITGNIGIYFRYNTDPKNELFNKEISLLGYNKPLSDLTQIAGVSNNKLPKFMIKSEWKPQTVISFTNSFRSNKSYIYCTDVDLIVYYNSVSPLNKDVYAIM